MTRKAQPPELQNILAAFEYPSSMFIHAGMYRGMWRVHLHGYLSDAERDLLIDLLNEAQRERIRRG